MAACPRSSASAGRPGGGRGAAGSAAALGAALALAAALFDAEPRWVPALALVAVAAGTSAWVGLAARGLRVRRRLGARRVIEDEPLTVLLDVRTGRLALPGGRVVDPLLERAAPLSAGRRSGRVRVEVSFARRGRRALEPTRVVVADPLGLASRTVSAPPSAVDDEVLVLPRVEPVTVAGPGDGEGRPGARRPVAAAEVDLDGLRPLREGTAASRIFWPSLARGAELMERRLAADADARPLVVLDPRGAAREEDLDAAVRAAGSLAVHLARAGGCALLLPGERRATGLEPSLTAWPRAHARLALVGGAARANLGAVGGRRGPVLYVSAQVRARLPRALVHAPAAHHVLVVPGVLPGRRPAFSVAGCHGYAGAARGAVGPAARPPAAPRAGRDVA